MSGLRVVEAQFVAAATKLPQLPTFELPEIALIGRSNVGKSTLLNRITGRKKLARTSATPGRTQEINLFNVTLQGADLSSVVVADLPGFGFAKVSKTQRTRLQHMVAEYLEQRAPLQLICLLNDIRRMPGEEELAVQEVAFATQRRFLLVLTKSDTVNQSERVKQRRKVTAAYNLEEHDALLSSEDEPAVRFWERALPLLVAP